MHCKIHGVEHHLGESIRAADRHEGPFQHWLLRRVLPLDLAFSLASLPVIPPVIEDTKGRRETHNASRLFITETMRDRYPDCFALISALQDEGIRTLIEQTCRVSLASSYLRVEYCLDTDGFWLEPHTDITAKLFTMLIYLSTHPDAEDWGTDLLDSQYRIVGRASGNFNSGLIFIPAADTWHGFAPRRIAGIRRSLIVNYVVSDWHSRHELAFPEEPITHAAIRDWK